MVLIRHLEIFSNSFSPTFFRYFYIRIDADFKGLSENRVSISVLCYFGSFFLKIFEKMKYQNLVFVMPIFGGPV